MSEYNICERHTDSHEYCIFCCIFICQICENPHDHQGSLLTEENFNRSNYIVRDLIKKMQELETLSTSIPLYLDIINFILLILKAFESRGAFEEFDLIERIVNLYYNSPLSKMTNNSNNNNNNNNN